VADIGEEWLYEHFDGRAKNIKFTTLHPGSMLSDLARKSVPGKRRSLRIQVWFCCVSCKGCKRHAALLAFTSQPLRSECMRL
jgi:hypothetical protein